ncbi:ABC transporter permease [Rhodonellum psychrophilum GCM71 = DSM 17998]|uniref:ABC transporter permease n=2 Tax=Rhodonellum TaxID=336827 RepID=U5BYB0_9BACT|nr:MULTISPECIES: FtsX-like permease family protein [Rhodonellum]ERM82823.1 ABC transporter permease [Rhodonellum psychrophilum GCM71 = DSM 17998]MDO9551032.1 ABC transporter permease [Rhodonellum sp.]SDY96730.1 putative ABC transport system permease protein [Rhodonellum ikkaensis]
MNMLKLSWKYLIFKPLNTGLNILLLALGLAIITVLILIQDQFENKMTQDAKGIDLVVGAKGSPLQLILSSIYHIDYPTGNIDLKDAQSISKNRLIKNVIPLGMGDNYEGFRIVGTNHDYLELYTVAFQGGSAWEKPFDVVLGSEVAKKLKLNLGDNFIGSHGIGSSSHEHDAHPYRVTGILQPKGNVVDNLILTSIESVWYTHDEEHDHAKMEASVSKTGFPLTEEDREVTSLLLQYRNPIAAVQLPRMINSKSALQAASPSFEISRLFELLGVGVKVIQGLAIVIIVIAGLGIFIALFNSLKERKYDLAVMRTLGASSGQLFLHIVLEGVILTFLGALLGIAIGHLFLAILVMQNEQGVLGGLTAAVFLKEEFLILAFAIGVGFIASLIPAWTAYQTDIAKQLTKS